MKLTRLPKLPTGKYEVLQAAYRPNHHGPDFVELILNALLAQDFFVLRFACSVVDPGRTRAGFWYHNPLGSLLISDEQYVRLRDLKTCIYHPNVTAYKLEIPPDTKILILPPEGPFLEALDRMIHSLEELQQKMLTHVAFDAEELLTLLTTCRKHFEGRECTSYGG